MFVRFKKRKKQTNWTYDEQGSHRQEGFYDKQGYHAPKKVTVQVYDAILVQSERVSGKPVQKFIDTLGSISEDAMKNEWQLYRFWVRARETLYEIIRVPHSWGLPPEFLTSEKAKGLIHSMEKTIPAISEERMRELITKEYSSDSEIGIKIRIAAYVDFCKYKKTEEEERESSKEMLQLMKALGYHPNRIDITTVTPEQFFHFLEKDEDEDIEIGSCKASVLLDFLRQVQHYSPESVESN